MKRALLTVGLIIGLCGAVYADPINMGDVVGKLPNLKQNLIYSIPDSAFDYATTAEVMSKGKLVLDVGFSPRSMLVTAISYDIGSLKQYANVPLLEYTNVSVGAYYGFDRINEFQSGSDYGAIVKLVEINF